MTLRDCYRLSLHTIKENKYRSILTIVISIFLSTLIMGMMCIAVSFGRNGVDVICEAYFRGDPLLTIQYYNGKQLKVEEHEVFTEAYYENFMKAVDKYKDVVQFIQYNASFNCGIRFADPNFSNFKNVKIVEGRNIEKSESRNEVIVKNDTFRNVEENEEYIIGNTYIDTVSYPTLDEFGYVKFDETTIEYVVVGKYEIEYKDIVLNGNETVIEFNRMIGDVGIIFNLNNPYAYIEYLSIYHNPQDKVSNPERTIKRLVSLKNTMDNVLPQALTTETFIGPPVELILHYKNATSCQIYEVYEENNAIRYTIIAASTLFSIILLLISIGSLANSVVISIDRSKKFIGLLKALGMRGRPLILVIILEAITLIAIGVLIGYLVLLTLYSPLASITNAVVNSSYGGYIRLTGFVPKFSLPIYVFFGTLLMFLLLTFIFSRGSLRKIAKMDPIIVINEVS